MLKMFKGKSNRDVGAGELTFQPSPEFMAMEEKKKQEVKNCRLSDFEIRATLGTGSFGMVRLVKHKKSGRVYAMKMLSKQLVLKTRQLEHIKREREVLAQFSHPFIVNLYVSFQDEMYLYLCLEYSIGGEFFSHLRKAQRFPDDTSKFYAAGVALVFEYMHNQNIVYRDLKPENLLLDSQGHLKVCDFGFAKPVEPGQNTWTLCGTPEYLAPEIILNKGHGAAVDWWALGILIFEMLAGYPPFEGDDRMQLYKAILAGRVDYPKHFKREARDLVSKLLQADLSHRLGNLKDGARDIRTHPWFKGFDFEALLNRSMPAPIRISVRGEDDASMFEDVDEEGPDKGCGKVSPDEQRLFADF
eukprot:CAMPEP_0196724168 /NCGR_PEP_ID=MMETSP1091-20130531/6137_1 /TAXON_ID=302021 /ORGANISM="Rhodomonas sp., Strain CCMP768" /LENGTH=357 /DNA_ID=CAMNT_0042066267 /DNA_START=209 /DNA_END=1282 /DNA_ORIENTATION=-